LKAIQKKGEALDVSDEVREEIQTVCDKLKNSTMRSPETTILQNYLKWIVDLPWGIETSDNTNLVHAKKILDQGHFGLESVKEKILDYLAVKTFKKDCDGLILCLCGSPGVGKTSIGKSIARALGKKFCRISLAGLHDETEIRGHCRTYIGAMPGRLIQAIKKVGSCNPLIMLDELDKIGTGTKGDPCSALLEVLDPEQNKTFYDNYLGVPFDLSRVMFIATANYIEQIPKPLRDRMEVIMLPEYTVEEKFEIAKRYLIPKAVTQTGLEGKGFEIDDDTLKQIIFEYTCGGGMRLIKRHIETLCAKFARSLLEKS
jgi:ATP-dependent Lon protease